MNPAETETSPPQSDFFDVETIRGDFPALAQRVHGHPLVYLDNAATTQKPQAVIDRITGYYARENSNIHRGVHFLSQQATDRYEEARQKVARFIGAPDPHEVIFTRGTTEGINLVASTFGRQQVGPGDEVVISAMEHHSNIVPWQLLCEAQGAHLRVIPITDSGELDYEAFERLLSERTKLVALCHISNALGTVNPVARIVEDAHARGIPVLLDGAQAAPHHPIDVQALGCDFYCLSGHKMFGPTGVGVLYGKRERLDAMPPYQGGGDMIETVTFERTTFNELPHKFEAGTPNIAGGIGLGAAADYLEGLGMEAVEQYEAYLLSYATERLQEVEGLRIVGQAAHRAGAISFLLEDLHPYDAGTVLDQLGIAVRTGHHCTQPLMQRLGIPGTIRASFALYNTVEDVDALVDGIEEVRRRLHDRTAVALPEAPRTEASVEERGAEIAAEFDLFDTLDEKRDYLMDLGKGLPPLADRYKTEQYRIHGCLSQVWLHADLQDGRVRFEADSNAMVTKGLIALLVRVLDAQPPEEIVRADLGAFMDRIGMQHLISSNRKNGLAAMIKQMKLYALAFAKMQSAAS